MVTHISILHYSWSRELKKPWRVRVKVKGKVFIRAEGDKRRRWYYRLSLPKSEFNSLIKQGLPKLDREELFMNITNDFFIPVSRPSNKIL